MPSGEAQNERINELDQIEVNTESSRKKETIVDRSGNRAVPPNTIHESLSCKHCDYTGKNNTHWFEAREPVRPLMGLHET